MFKSRIFSLLLIGSVLSSSGCASDNATIDAPTSEISNTGSASSNSGMVAVTIQPAASAVPSGAEQITVTAFSSQGTVVYGPLAMSVSSPLTVLLPTTSSLIELQYFAQENVLGTFIANVALTATGTVTIPGSMLIHLAGVGGAGAPGATAVPDYRLRASINAGLAFAGPWETSVISYYQATGAFPSSPAQIGISSTGLNPTPEVASITLTAGGVITITYNPAAVGPYNLILTPSAPESGSDVSWTLAGTAVTAGLVL